MILAKLISESLLSLYPTFIKKTPVQLDKQLLTRLMGYSIIPLFFISYKFIGKSIFSKNTLLLSLITFIHILFSYKGFKILNSGIAYTIFYLYPIMLIFWKNKRFSIFYLTTFIGLILLTVNMKDIKTSFSQEKIKGIIYVLLATITEVIIYFLVKNLNTDNQWNTIFLSYFPAFIIYGIYYLYRSVAAKRLYENRKRLLKNIQFDYKVPMLLGFNVVVGLVGYYLRFVSVKKVPTNIYAVLSYFGIFMSYIYGYIFDKEKITMYQLLGTITIVLSNYMLIK